MRKLEIIKNVTIFCLFGFFVWGMSRYFDADKFYPRMLEHKKEETYFGTVVEKYTDKRNHNTPVLKFSNGSETGLENTFWNQIAIGDSLMKRKDRHMQWFIKAVVTLSDLTILSIMTN